MHTSRAQFKFYYVQAGSFAIYISELPFATTPPTARATRRFVTHSTKHDIRATRQRRSPNIIITNEFLRRFPKREADRGMEAEKRGRPRQESGAAGADYSCRRLMALLRCTGFDYSVTPAVKQKIIGLSGLPTDETGFRRVEQLIATDYYALSRRNVPEERSFSLVGMKVDFLMWSFVIASQIEIM